MKKALIIWGGWDGHEPDKVAEIFRSLLVKNDFEVEVSATLDSFNDANKLKELHLIVPVWTGGKLNGEQETAVCEAVADGTGIAGCHGGMCDAFREAVQWQFMTGANWVSHPGGDSVEYTVNLNKNKDPLVKGIPDFSVKSEQYYLHVDPAVKVLATTRFPVVQWYHSPNGEVDMPVVWTKLWGAGRVFYSSLGHHADIFDKPAPLEIMQRGLLWAAEGKEFARVHGLSAETYRSDKKMF
jgi:type 1 glutamine amidotransferase